MNATLQAGAGHYWLLAVQCAPEHPRVRDTRRSVLHRWPDSGCLKFALGLTIIELLVALTIASILMAVGAPAMGGFIKNNRLSQSSFDVLGNINFARSEAVKRRVRVVLCRSANSTAASPTCGGTASNWTTGWLIFASGDGNSTYQSGTDTLLGIGVVSSNGVDVKTNSTSNNNLEYNPDGTTNEGGGTARFAICDNRGGGYGKQINIPPHGRPKFVKATRSDPINCTTPS